MKTELEGTCATCRFITYTRTVKEGPKDLFCENPELMQKFASRDELFFLPPKLAFACNRWAMRAPDLGFIPATLRDEPPTPDPEGA